jgi:hypothetical protein
MKRALALVLACAGMAHAADREFDRVVGAIEKHYGVKRTHVPLMGVANLFIKVAHPAGTSGLKLAFFDELTPEADTSDLDRFMEDICRGGLRPVIVTHSRRDAESSYILAGEAGKSSKLLIASFERREATVIEVEVNTDTLFRMIGNPADAHRLLQHDRQDYDDGR